MATLYCSRILSVIPPKLQIKSPSQEEDWEEEFFFFFFRERGGLYYIAREDLKDTTLLLTLSLRDSGFQHDLEKLKGEEK